MTPLLDRIAAAIRADGYRPTTQVLVDARDRIEKLETALRFYADRDHFALSDPDAWDTVSDEPQNFWCDEAGTATVEDGTIARAALEGKQPAARR